MLGFGIPFFVAGSKGYISAAILIIIGSFVFWVFEKKTVSQLEKPSILNDVLNTTESDE